MFCPKCGKQIEVTDQFCPSCGCSISNASAQDFAQTRVSAPTKNVALALILSVIIPGLGQIYCGKVLKGILFLVISILLLGFSTYMMHTRPCRHITKASIEQAILRGKSTEGH